MFLDTNILVYAHGADAVKSAIALSLIEQRPTISVQVLNEFVVASMRRSGMSLVETTAHVRKIGSDCTVVPLTEAVHQKALAIAERHQLHIYDANIWAAAILSGCETLYSEDMHAGLTIEGTMLRNPFLA